MSDLTLLAAISAGSCVRLDTFRVPAQAVPTLLATSRRIVALLSTLEGFMGHSALHRADGNVHEVVTLVAWRSRDAAAAAGPRVAAFTAAHGLDVAKVLRELGITMTRTDYDVVEAEAGIVD